MLKLPKLFGMAALLLLSPCAIFAQDRANGTDPLEAQFRNHASYPSDITEIELRDLQLSDPKLRVAYYWLIKGANGGPEIVDDRHPAMVEILKDLKRRGDSTTPLWMDIMANNRGAYLEYRIPMVLSLVGSINMRPYVDYLREMIQTRGQTISGGACGVALDTFFKYGAKDDVQLVLELAKKRPFLAPFVNTVVDSEERNERFRAQKLMQKTALAPDPPQSQYAENATEKKYDKISGEERGFISLPWTAITAVFSMAGIGLFWFLRKGRK